MSTSDTPAVPVSLPLDLQAWERLARAAIDAQEALRQARLGHNLTSLGALRIAADGSRVLFDRECTPERILGLIAAAQQGADDKARLDEIQSGAVRIEGRGTTRPCQYWHRQLAEWTVPGSPSSVRSSQPPPLRPLPAQRRTEERDRRPIRCRSGGPSRSTPRPSTTRCALTCRLTR